MVKFVPHFVIALSILLVEPHNINHRLRVFLLLLFRDTVFLQQPLPFLREASELTGLIVIANVRNVHGVLRGGDLDASGGA